MTPNRFGLFNEAQFDDGRPNLSPMVSFGGGGGSKQKTTQKAGTEFNDDFLTKLFSAFPLPKLSQGGEAGVTNVAQPAPGTPGYSGVAGLGDVQQFNLPIPKFQGLDDMDFNKLNSDLYSRSMQNLTPTYERERQRTNEQLSQSGILNSGIAYGKGGALENLTHNYLDASGKAATDAAIKTTDLKQQELARKTGFDFDLLKTFEDIYTSITDIILRSGGVSTSRSVGTQSPTFQFGVGGSK